MYLDDNIKKNLADIQILLRDKEFTKAENLLHDNLKITQNNFETFFLLGTIAGIKKNFDKAETYLKKSLSINPKHINANINLAIILKKNNKIEEAKNLFEKTNKLDENNLESLCGLAQIYEENKNFKEAESFYQKVLKINTNHHVANHSYGKLLLKLNKHKEGLKLIEKISGIIRFEKEKFLII